MMTALNRGLWPGVARCLSKQTTYGQFYFFSGATECAFATFVHGKRGIVELKGAEVAAATVPPAVAPTAEGVYGRPDPRVEADSIGFDVWAGSKETDLRRKAAENAHRQAQA